MSRTLIYSSIFLFLGMSACKNDAPPPSETAQKQLTAGFDTLTGQPQRYPNPWKNAGCDLVTDSEVARIFNIDPKEATLNTQTLPDKGFCLRTWNKADWKERESNNDKQDTPYMEPHNTLVLQVLDYGTPATATAQFDMLRKDRRNTYKEDVPNLGEDAMWSNTETTLVVKKKHLVVNIKLEHQDQQHDNLAKAIEVAKVALGKM